VIPLIQMIVAVEMLLLPVWVAAVSVRPRRSGLATDAGSGEFRARLSLALAPVIVLAVLLLGLGAMAEPSAVGAVLAAQAVAVGFTVLLTGIAAVLHRWMGSIAAQIVTVLVGGLLLGGIILAGPLADLTTGPTQAIIVCTAVYANPLVVAERALDLDWLHQDLTYRWTPLGESYGYLLQDASWWRTLLAHLFIGSGLLVFGATGGRRKNG
jgi:hypothetical protein